MADRVEFGLDKELAAKMATKYDPEQERQAREWIEAVTGETQGEQTFATWLKSGVVLCKLANAIRPDAVPKVHTSKLAPMQRENINFFVNFARSVGVPEFSVFSSDDLYEEKNMVSVINCIHLLGGAVQVSCPGFAGPKLGIAVNAEVTDKKRFSGVATDQSGGLSKAMEVARPSEGMDSAGIMRVSKTPSPPTSKTSSPRPAASKPISPRPEASKTTSPRPATSTAAGYSPGPSPPVAPAPATAATDSGPALGLDKDLAAKRDAKYDPELEKEVVSWVEGVVGETKGDQSVAEWLRSGVVLCKLVNSITPGRIPKVHASKIAAFQYENINFFVNAARDLGVPEHTVFSGPDLFEEKNMNSVVSCLYAFGGVVQVACPSFNGPKLGTAIHAQTHDTRRETGPITDASAGLSTAMQVQRPDEHLDKVVRH